MKGLDRINVPGNVKYVSRRLADAMQVEEEVLRKHALENTLRFFGIDLGLIQR